MNDPRNKERSPWGDRKGGKGLGRVDADAGVAAAGGGEGWGGWTSAPEWRRREGSPSRLVAGGKP